ncbi:hypothetical protein A5893_11020 [Pedobacter psychrophilus]|uniref:DUF4349 domain-containing protein n=2 Tax=Pedobacter psychrophilus TaxID=1826909 RepID=A0A179DER1_9SPHI|nr:hypothetical protein A5893_11020 [Pedobacter psychrophilus]
MEPLAEVVMDAKPQSSDEFNSKDKEDNSPPIKVNQVETKNKKIIKDGSLSIKSKNIGESKKNIDAVLKTMNAYYETENLQNDNNQASYDLKIRIPSVNFEKLISAIEKGNDEVLNKNIQARDVTEEFVDLTSRLESKQAYLIRYKALLSKASTIKDILEIEEKIRVIQEEIESAQGRLKYLKDQVSFSSLSVNLFQEKEYVYKPNGEDSFLERFKKSVANGWEAVVGFLLLLISVWPFLILIVIGVYLFKRYRFINKK